MAALILWLIGGLVLPLALLLVLWLSMWLRGAQVRARLARCREQIPGPPALPFVGNAFDLGINVDVKELINYAMMVRKKYGPLFRLWAGPIFAVVITDPHDIEVLLSSIKHIEKAPLYSFFHPWLGQGLLTSSGNRWHKHRKIITPAFHFKILEQFVDIFNKQGDILLSKLKESTEEYLDVFPYVDLYTQDVICETAMGVELNSQTSGCSTDYLEAVKETCEVIGKRMLKPWFYPDFTFQLSSYGRIQRKNLRILHSMTHQVIKERKHHLQSHSVEPDSEILSQVGKKKLPFLDLLLLSAKGGDVWSDTDIREEVDTFMFEGHDTTASAISFSLYELARHPNIQEKIYAELKEIEEDGELNLSINTLNGLKYLEQVIKEALRLYPSVPMIGREITEDLYLPKRNIVIPPGTWMAVLPFVVHRDPEIFPCPDVFNPDNFSPEAVQKRHPFAYIPFSAGPRNCIGQKFVILEIKSVLSKIVWNFHLKIEPNFKLKLLPGLTLKSLEGIPISFTSRIQS